MLRMTQLRYKWQSCNAGVVNDPIALYTLLGFRLNQASNRKLKFANESQIIEQVLVIYGTHIPYCSVLGPQTHSSNIELTCNAIHVIASLKISSISVSRCNT